MHAANVLEFESLRALVARYVRSALGRAELAQIEPICDRAQIEAALAETAEARPCTSASAACFEPGNSDRARPFRRYRRVWALRSHSCASKARRWRRRRFMELARLLDLAAEARRFCSPLREKFPRLAAYASRDRRSARPGPRIARQNSSRWHARRPRQRRAGPPAPRSGKAAPPDSGFARALPARPS